MEVDADADSDDKQVLQEIRNFKKSRENMIIPGHYVFRPTAGKCCVCAEDVTLEQNTCVECGHHLLDCKDCLEWNQWEERIGSSSTTKDDGPGKCGWGTEMKDDTCHGGERVVENHASLATLRQLYYRGVGGVGLFSFQRPPRFLLRSETVGLPKYRLFRQWFGETVDAGVLPLFPGLQEEARTVPRAECRNQWTEAEQDMVKLQMGQIVKQLSAYESPTGRFGDWDDKHSSWAEAFEVELEGALRDAEDQGVQVDYAKIRHFFKLVRPALEKVMQPQLMVLDAVDTSKVWTSGSGKDIRIQFLLWTRFRFGDPLASLWPVLAWEDSAKQEHPGRLAIYGVLRGLVMISEATRNANMDEDNGGRRLLKSMLGWLKVTYSC